MKFRDALVAATMMAIPLAAQAQPITGLYVGGGVGANLMQDEDVKLTGKAGGGRTQLRPSIGPAFDLSVGYGLGNGLRAEIEGNYLANSFHGATGAGVGGGGQEQKFGAFFNVLYDIVGLSPMVQPYVGVGAGYEWAKESNLHVNGRNFVASAKNDTKGDFAYQGIIGAAFPIAGAPGLAITADYRFMGLMGSRKYNGVVGATPASFKLDNNFNHTVLIGFRYAFGAAPMAAPMAPAPAAVAPSPISRSYLVFFDWDRAELSERARQIVSEAAANSTKVQYTRLEVNGYTDTSGTPKYNQGLSIRRARAVAAQLVTDGVPKSAISIQGFGETHLLVPTGAGVREPQNRRVEIIIQ